MNNFLKKKSGYFEDRDVKLLTPVELELMKILWDSGEGTVNDVMAALPDGRELAYTSVSTILRILEKKGILKSRKKGRAHIYTPIFGKKAYEAKSLMKFVENVFDGTPATLVKRLLDTEKLSTEDLEEIKKMIEQKEG